MKIELESSDITKLEGVSKEGLKAIHKIKRVYPGSTVEDIESEQKKI